MFGVILIGAVIGFTLAGCDNRAMDDGGGGGGGLWAQPTQGTRTWVPNAGGDYPSFKFEDYGEGYKGHEVRDAF